MDVHLRDLRYFVAAARELNVTRAAEQLYVSQPAVSKQLRALERQLGYPLFHRRPGGITLTPYGEQLLIEATRVLDAWQAGADRVARAGDHATFTVGMHTAVGRGLNTRLHETAAELGYRLRLRVVPWTDPTAGLLDGTSDAAILWRPVDAPGITLATLASEPRYVALPDGHPLAGRPSVRRDDLRDESFIALPPAAGELRRFWLAENQAPGAVRVAMEASSPDEVFESVAARTGIALVAEGNRDLYARPGIVFVPVTDIPPAELALAWRTDTTNPATQAMLAALTRPSDLDSRNEPRRSLTTRGPVRPRAGTLPFTDAVSTLRSERAGR